ncbi:MAG: class D sortase [Actinomycetota bacterium]|nr:class D sortase [Actinomycetota bacterium]
MSRWARVLVGLALVWGALGALGYRLGWEIHAKRGQSTLLGSARTVVHEAAQCSGTPITPSTDGVLAGVLSIPSLGVTAPVESGTTDTVLNVAVGHFDGTPWPGSPGTAAMLAHDVSYFARIDQLRPGDRIRYQSGCVSETFTVVGHQIVRDGAPLPPVAGTAMVLDTCWPTDALWYTPDRYVVEAVESGIDVGSPGMPSTPMTSLPTGFTTPAPAGLQATGLSLVDNEEPMGTMAIGGTPSARWSQSPAPLALESAALAAYFGAYHAATRDNGSWWSAVAPGVPTPVALIGATPVLSRASPLDITIDAVGDRATGITLNTVLPLSGGSAPGTYRMTVTEAVHGTTVVIASWEVSHD